MKKLSVNIFIFFLFASNAFADGFCGNSILVSLIKDSDGLSSCPNTVADYPYSLDVGCSVAESFVVGCLYVYKICCGDTSKKYEDSTVQTLLSQSVTIGQEEVAAQTKYEEFKDSAVVPACTTGFQTTSEMMGYVYLVTPSYSTNDYTKSDVAVSAWNRVGCSKFTVTLNPVQSGGGTNAESLAELQAINIALAGIKTVLDNVPNTTNPLLTDIKTLLQDGLNFNSEVLETGINQVAVNTAAGNGILSAINEKIIQDCTTVNVVVPGSCWDSSNRFGPPVSCQEGSLNCVCSYTEQTECGGIKVSDSNSLVLLGEIRDILTQSGGFGNYTSGSSVNVDMEETNGFLSDIKDFFSGSSTLSENNDTSASKEAYSSSFFEEGTPTTESYKDLFNDFVGDMKSTSLYGLMGGFFSGVPNSGISTISFNGGVYGSHSFDFSSWGSILTVIKALVLIIFAAMSMKIIFLKGGSG